MQKNIIVIIILLFSINLHALNSKKVYDYSLETVYSTLIRYIVLKKECKILEKDIEGAYIIFTSKDISGKIELIKRGKKKVEMILHWKSAHYKMVLFMKDFEKKLFDEQKIKE